MPVPQQQQSRRWLTPEDAAKYTHTSKDTIYRACHRGLLKFVRLNGRRDIRIRTDWCDQWLEAFAQDPQAV